ncbi:MAG: M48 family metalloprotease [Planctomycetota bacterium]|jgi:predicted Zn-dependent protease
MPGNDVKTKKDYPLTRRDFLRITSLLGAGFVAGCAIDPVTGKQTLMLVSEDQEIAIDRRNSPHQFSADNGVVQDQALNDYVSQVGQKMTAKTHRPHMPYSFRVVNATYVNAYAFPGGSIACTRGIMLALDNEAELAALLGHELGHVNARHTAEQMSKGQLTQAVVGGLSVLAGSQGATYGQMASQLGMIGAGALLASYSRDNEREADDLGMEYMVRSGYNPQGMVGLMDVLRGMSKRNPSAIELMFATHPMSEERYQTAKQAANTEYLSAQDLPLYRERYMDNTARLRSQKAAIEDLRRGETEMMKRQFGNAQVHFQQALKLAPNDYAAFVMMSTSLLVQERYAEGITYAEQAQQVYPREGKAYHLSGFAKLQTRDFDGAYQEFATYEEILPGNPNTVFYGAYALEGMQRREQAAQEYHRYLQSVTTGDNAKYAYRRLQEWGYYKAQ